MHYRATISDVAKLAGVSKVTVSYVLNGRGREARISESTQQRVLEAAKELNYSPNALAKSMMNGKLDTLGVVFQHAYYFADSSDFTMDLMHGATAGALKAKHNLMLHTKPVLNAQEEANELMNGTVSGVLVLRNMDDPALAILIERRFPVVLFFSRTDNKSVPFVDADNFNGAKSATEHLISLGHRRIGMISGDPESRSAQDRFAGFENAMQGAGLKIEPSDVQPALTTQEYESFRRYFSRPTLPTAIFCYSDLLAFQLMRVASEMGISIPTDLSVVGFDSVEACDRSIPPLTSVRQPVREIAHTAVVLLSNIVNGVQVTQTQIVYPTTLDIRGSTAPPRPS